MNRRTKLMLVGAVALVTIGGTAAAVAATAGDDDATERPITGSVLDAARAAALAHTGGGTVTGTEVDDEESKYEVEVTLDDGSQVDVQLDESFDVVGDEADSDRRED